MTNIIIIMIMIMVIAVMILRIVVTSSTRLVSRGVLLKRGKGCCNSTITTYHNYFHWYLW